MEMDDETSADLPSTCAIEGGLLLMYSSDDDASIEAAPNEAAPNEAAPNEAAPNEASPSRLPQM